MYRGVDETNGRQFALKVIDYSEDVCIGIPPHVLREISTLMELRKINHPNLVKLENVIPQPCSYKTLLVFEWCDGDLARMINQ